MFANPAVARSVSVGLDAVRFASGAFVAPKLPTMSDTVVGGPIWSLAVPVAKVATLVRAARPFAMRAPIVFASHPEGKGAGDYVTPSRDSGTPRDKQPAGERPSERSGGYRTPDTSSPTRSGGSSEKLGLASTERPDDRGARKSGEVDRPGQSRPAPRDPDGGVAPSRRNGDNGGIGWGGGGSDSGFGGGSRNEPI